ncbi:MAG: hypothetical protein E6Q44_04280, partial [Flavobacteriales bacterium]
MQRSTVRCTERARTRRRPWALPLAAATLALCSAGLTQAQVAQYSLSYDKLLKTSSILQADEDAAFEPITGGTVLADGTQAAVAGNTTFGVGYKEYETVAVFFGSTTRPKDFAGNACFVGNTGAGDAGASDAEYQATGMVVKTGPGYPIGFNFTYNGEVFDRVGISSQGWIGFGNSADGGTAVAVYTAQTQSTANLPLNNTTLLANDSRRNRVVATGVQGGSFNSGYNTMPIVFNPTYPAYPGAELRYETIGTAPNRVFVVQWRNYGFTISSLDHQYYRRMDFQIRLHETTNEVEVRFGKAWRSNTTSYFQTGLGGKTGGSGASGSFNSFGFYDASSNSWTSWPYAFTAQTNHSGYPGSSEFSQRIPWTGAQGYDPYNAYGSNGSAEDYYNAIFTQTHSLAGSPGNDATRNISGTKANTPDMMSFTWTPPTCLVTVSGLVATGGLTSVDLSWTGTGDVDYAIGTGNSPASATFTGTVAGSPTTVTGLTASTNYKAWIRTNCGGGATSMWLGPVAFNTLPCPVASFYYGIYPISNVQISGLNNSSSADPIYDGSDPARFQDYTGVVGNVFPTLSYPITVSGYNGGGNVYVTAYVDWDQDGVFEASFPLNGGNASSTGSLTGNIEVPAGAPAGNARMRIVQCNDWSSPIACGIGMYYGQVEDYTLNVGVLTCPPPLGLAASNVAVHSADLSWTASNNSTGYQWEVRTSGAAGSGSTGLAASSTAAGTSTSVSGLNSNTAYTFYVRSDCGGGDYSPWMSGSFTTPLGCGDTWVSPGGVANLTDQQFSSTFTVCPETVGDVVTIDFTAWNGLRWNAPNASRIYIYNGDNTAAPMVPGGNGPAYSGSEWTLPAGGWTSTNTANEPPIYTSSAASGCLTVQIYSAGIWTGGMGWSADFTCAPAPTCFAPTNLAVTSTQVHDATFTWTAGASPNVEWIVVANGGTPASPVLATGTSATGTATATGLTANTQYTAYFRGLCDDLGVGDDPSAWSSIALNFRTKVGCGGPYNLFSTSAYAGYPSNTDSTITICPDNAGDVVTLTMSKFKFGWSDQGLVGLFVHNGPNTSAPIFHSGQPSKTSGANTLPAGAYWGNAYWNVLPGPFTSTHPSGCITLRFRSWSAATYDQGMESAITCGPAPACSTPDAVTVTGIGNTSATITWGNTSEPCVVEYGPVGFTPGTGATAGSGTVASTTATSPFVLTGLSATTKYEVRVRQACSGGTVYSANSFFARFTTSMDCSTAQVLSCGAYVSDAAAPPAYTMGNAAYNGDLYTGAASCFQGSANNGNGTEWLYRFTATEAGTHAINAGISNAGGTTPVRYVVAPVSDGCAASAFTCIGSAPANTGGLLNFTVPAAGDYYIMSDANEAVHQRPFTLMCPGIPPCVANPTFPANGNSLAVNSNAITFTWPAAFGAASYDVYFMGNLVANTPTNSINGGGSYTTANIKALYGLGTTITWRVVPKNSYGTATCPTDWTFTVGGNGSTNAIPLTEGVAQGGNNFAANGYSDQNGTFWGNDAWYSFTATNCADSAEVSLCLPANQAATYTMMEVRRASDNTVVFPPADNSTFYAYTASGACFQYERFDEVIWNWVYENPKFVVAPGETYYVIVDSYGTNYNFTVAYNEITNSPDSDEDGILDCADSCPFFPGQNGDLCYAGPLFTSASIVDCECVGSGPVPCSNDLTLEFQTDGNPGQTTWELVEQGTDFVVQQGGPLNAVNGGETNGTCLPNGCFYLRVLDAAGDGMTTGGYILRTNSGQRIIDNRNNFSTGSESRAA